MEIFNWYLEVLRKYAVFSGRARRKEFWCFSLVSFIIVLVLTVLDNQLGTFHRATDLGLFVSLYCLAILIPEIAVTVRRLHDTGRSGWWILLMLPYGVVGAAMGAMSADEMPVAMGLVGIMSIIGLIGLVVLLVFMVLDSQPGSNQFGPNPKGEDIAPAMDSGMGMGSGSGTSMNTGSDSGMGSSSDSGMGQSSGMESGSDSDSRPPSSSN